MAKKKDVEDAASAGTAADVFASFIDGLVTNSTITADVAGIVKHAISHASDKLNAAVKAAD